ncbi:F-box domain containing protein [Tanacetum coccineum]
MSSAKLSFRGKASQAFVERILNYAFSHNIKQLTLTCLNPNTEFPLSLFGSQSLEHLTFAGFSYPNCAIFTSTWELTSLTTLHFESIVFNDEVTAIFSKCVNLKKLVVKGCDMTRSNVVDICHPGLCDLTLENGHNFKNLRRVKYLSFKLEMCQLLSSLMELISCQPSPFVNLKSLKVYPRSWWCVETIHAQVKKYLLDGSPSATFTDSQRSHARYLRHDYMVLLDMHHARGDLRACKNSRLCMEADAVMSTIMDVMAKKQSRLSIYFHDLAMASNPSF